jgi:hypothetical protein
MGAIVRITKTASEHNSLKWSPPKNRSIHPEELANVWGELGIPVAPQSNWICGTDLVWPVIRMVKPADIFFPELPPYVCRHMIVAGD